MNVKCATHSFESEIVIVYAAVTIICIDTNDDRIDTYRLTSVSIVYR